MKCASWLRLKITSRTAERIGLVSEVIHSIQFVKMFAWEKPFEKLIEFSRRKEVDIFTRASYLRGLSISFMAFPERVALLLTLASYVLLGNYDITADKVSNQTVPLYQTIWFF
ncbi:hypothetical protein PR048_028113 [Dryococelus australis]|uniref:ABC transmembrane type-1 domain-containing protein n=1 Tax=Dryococelus australis TaxID=614101 RepID=A0ABQ9GIC1_9NEOP|nr:hypothetical protein PR048_028113 [Dryococelus australis]